MARKKMKKVRKKEKRIKRKQRKQGKKEKKQCIVKEDGNGAVFEDETKENFADEFVEISADKMDLVQVENDGTSTDYSEGGDDENSKEIEGTNDDEFALIFGEF